MGKENSFDIVSKVDHQEVANALNQAIKEIEQRFDFKGTNTTIEWTKEEIVINTINEYKLKSVLEIVQEKLVKRGLSIKALEYGKVENALGGRAKQIIKIKEGLEQENAKKITKLIKDSKIKVQATVQGDAIRVAGKDKDDLQAVIQLIKNADLPLNLQFENYR